jgi:hypothetical protein
MYLHRMEWPALALMSTKDMSEPIVRAVSRRQVVIERRKRGTEFH